MRGRPSFTEIDATNEELERLKPHHRAVLQLRNQGHEYEHIAAMLGVSKGTVKSQLNRAREQVSKMRSNGC